MTSNLIDLSVPDKPHELITNEINRKRLFAFDTPRYCSIHEIKILISGFVNAHFNSTNHSFQSMDCYQNNVNPMKHPNVLIYHYLLLHTENLNLINTDPLLHQDRKCCYSCFQSTSQHNQHTSINIKFLLCSRCKIARYCNKKCQTKNWKFHKKSCRLLSDQEKIEITNSSVQFCANQLDKEYKAGTFSAKTALYLKQIKSKIDCKVQDDKQRGDASINLSKLYNTFIDQCATFYSHFLAAPGIPDLLFNTFLVKGSTMQKYQEHGRVNILSREINHFFDSWDPIPFESHGFLGFVAYIIATLTRILHHVHAQSTSNLGLLSFLTQRILEIFCDYNIQDDYQEIFDLVGMPHTICVLLPMLQSNIFVKQSHLGIEWNWNNLIMETNFLDIMFNGLKAIYDNEKKKVVNHYVPILKYISEHINFEMIWSNKIQGAYFLFVFHGFAFALKYFGGKCEHIQYGDTVKYCMNAISIALGMGHEEKVNVVHCVENVVKYHCIADIDEFSDDRLMRIYSTKCVEPRQSGMWCYMYYEFMKTETFKQLQQNSKFNISVAWELWISTMKQTEKHDTFRKYYKMCKW